MKYVLSAILVLIMTGAARGGETELYVKSGYFRWEETVNSQRFVKENGLIYTVGITHTGNIYKNLFVNGRLEVWGGNLDYDGYKVEEWTLYKTDTTYLGTREEISSHVNIPLTRDFSIAPLAGAGHKYWNRSRSEEDWNTFYGKFGGRIEYRFGKSRVFAEGGAIIPLYTRVHTDWSGSGFGDFVIEPKNKPSSFAEIGGSLGNISVSVYYEEMRFGKSDPVSLRRTNAPSGVALIDSSAYQPDSESSTWGLKVGYSF